MTFKSVIPRLTARSDDELGLFIVEWVMQNRLDHDRIYRTGDVTDFCNKEMNRVHDGLESIATKWRDPLAPDELVDLYVEKRLAKDKYRPITQVCYMYDALKGIFQHVHGQPDEKIVQTAVFMGERVRRAALARPDSVKQYQWERETTRQEYVRILAALRNGLSDETGLIYDR